jgi:RNA polymerase sigma-70 factor (ECF subfamily)
LSDLATKTSIWTEVAVISADLGRGDRCALTRLYDVAAPRLLRYAETLTRNRADAEDAMQSALVKVARKPKQLANADKPWAYLVRVVRNEALKVIGRRKPIASLASLLQAWRPVECPLEQQESREKVQEAVAKLPAEQAEVVVLKIWEQFTFAEIADLIDESPNTAASRYRYALEKLARHLQPLVDSARADIDQPVHKSPTSKSPTDKTNGAASSDALKAAKSAIGRSSRQEVPRV